MPIIMLWDISGKKKVLAGSAMYNCITRKVPPKESFLAPVKGHKIVELLNGDQVYIEDADFNRLKEYWEH